MVEEKGFFRAPPLYMLQYILAERTWINMFSGNAGCHNTLDSWYKALHPNKRCLRTNCMHPVSHWPVEDQEIAKGIECIIPNLLGCDICLV